MSLVDPSGFDYDNLDDFGGRDVCPFQICTSPFDVPRQNGLADEYDVEENKRDDYANGVASQTDQSNETGGGIIDVVFGLPGLGDETPEEQAKVNDMVVPVSLGDAAFFDSLLNCRPFLVCKVRMDEIADALTVDGDKKGKRRPKPIPVKILINGLEALGKVQMCDLANRSACDGTTPGVGTRPSRERTDAIILGIELGKIIGTAGQGRND